MRDSVFSHAAKSQKRVQRECVRRCGDDLHRKLPLFLMFIPDADGRPCTSWWGRYRTAQSLRTIRKLASSAVEDSPTRLWLQTVHRASVEWACRAAHPPETDDYRRCAEYCAQYVYVAFYEGSMVPLQLSDSSDESNRSMCDDHLYASQTAVGNSPPFLTNLPFHEFPKYFNHD